MIGFRYMLAILLIGFLVLVSCGKDEDNPEKPAIGTIQGRVSTAKGDTALVGALVTSSPPTSAVATDSAGGYLIPDVSTGQYIVTASKGGYNSGSVSIAVHAGKTTTANIQLTTGNRVPLQPVLRSPADGSIGQPTTITLLWSASDPDGDQLMFDVFLETLGHPAAKVSSDQSDTSFVATRLDTATTYSWSIVAKDPHGGFMSSPVATFTTRRDTIPEDSLVAFFPFNGNAHDASGNGHNGSVYGASLTADRFGTPDRAYAFDNSYIVVPHSADLSFDPTDSLSIELWVFRTEDSAPMHILGKRVECYGASWNYQLAVSYDNLMIGIGIPLNVWKHLCVTFDGSTIRSYLDGELQGSMSAQLGSENLVDLKIGNSDDCPTPWKGKLDDIRIYHRVLTGAEIRRLFHVGGW